MKMMMKESLTVDESRQGFFYGHLFLHKPPFQPPEQEIEQHGDDAEDQDGENHPVQFE